MSDDVVRLNIRLPQDVYEALKDRADEQSRTLTAQMVRVFRAWIAAGKPD